MGTRSALRHAKSTQRALKDTQGAFVNSRHSDTRRALGHSGTCALGHSKGIWALGTWTLKAVEALNSAKSEDIILTYISHYANYYHLH